MPLPCGTTWSIPPTRWETCARCATLTRPARRLDDGNYQMLSAEHVFKDYQFSVDHQIALPA